MTFYNPTYTFVANTLAQAGQVNANFAGVAAIVNGNIDTTNIAIAAGIKNTQCALCDSQFTMGGASGARPLPTSGALSGEYWHNGSWTQTGAITSSGGVRVHVNGSMTFGAFSWTAATECGGGVSGLSTTTTILGGSNGAGFGSGQGCSNVSVGCGGGGGGFGGAGGAGGSGSTSGRTGNGGSFYSISASLTGSGGGAGIAFNGTAGGAGGAGGGSIYIECTGAISLVSGSSITANGATGTASVQGGGGGGSGGGIQVRCLSTIVIASGASISVLGGGGGAGAAAGGGGGGGIIDLSGTFITNNGTLSATGGAIGTGSSGEAPIAGSTGIVNLNQFVQNVRSAG